MYNQKRPLTESKPYKKTKSENYENTEPISFLKHVNWNLILVCFEHKSDLNRFCCSSTSRNFDELFPSYDNLLHCHGATVLVIGVAPSSFVC